MLGYNDRKSTLAGRRPEAAGNANRRNDLSTRRGWLRLLGLFAWPLWAGAAEQTYRIDSAHTYPSFEADHLGISTWRGKFNESAGVVTLDRAAQTGSLDILIETGSIDFGHNLMNNVARSAQMFDVERFPQARYQGALVDFIDGVPTRARGTLTLRDQTLPLDLLIDRFKCITHPLLRREVCGANALGRFNRESYGIDVGKAMGFAMEVDLRIQVEAVLSD